MNKIGVSVSYDDVPRGRALLGSFAINKSQDNLTPIPSHFRTWPRAGFVPGAFGNINMKDSSLTSGTETTDCCVFAFSIVSFLNADDDDDDDGDDDDNDDDDDTLIQKPDVGGEKKKVDD